MASDLEKLIARYPTPPQPNSGTTGIDWNWASLSENSAISWHFIQNHLELPWEFGTITNRFDIEEMLPTIMDNPNKDWDWNWISGCKSLPIKAIPKCRTHLNFGLLSNHVSLEFIVSHQFEDWNWSIVSDRLEFDVKKYVLERPYLPWDWDVLSKNPYIDYTVVEYLLNHPNAKWNWVNLSLNISMDWSFIKKHIDKTWDWKRLSFNVITTWDIIVSNLSAPPIKWDWWLISAYNPNITYEIIIDNPNMPWVYPALSSNKLGHHYKVNQYKELIIDLYGLRMISNNSLPLYVLQEILLNEYDRISPFEVFTMLV